jgi:conjugative coupling factor TraD (TOL family)
MKNSMLEARLRPPVEFWSAAVAAWCGMVALIAPWALMMPPLIGLMAALMAFAFAAYRTREALSVLEYQEGLKFYKMTKIRPHKLPISKENLYFGEGFEWTQTHAQRMVDAARPDATPYVQPSPAQLRMRRYAKRLQVWASTAPSDRPAIRAVAAAAMIATANTSWWNPLKPFEDLGGSSHLHGVGFHERPVTLRQSERSGHLLVLGTTRVGKTRLLEILATQDIHNGHVTIVIDPKGDADLMLRMYAECARAGRLDNFYMFHLGYPEVSARYNGIGNFSRITEVASRTTNALPGSGNSAAFKEFSWRFTNLVAQAQVALGRVPTYESILRDMSGIDPLFLDYAKLTLNRETIAGSVRDWQSRWVALEDLVLSRKHPVPRALADRDAKLVAMVLLVKELRLQDAVLGGLSTAVSYERSFFEKIVASLGPFLEKLTTGKTGSLISPDYFDPNDPRPIFSWRQVIRQGGVVYVGLDALSDAVVGSAVGNSMLADLVSEGGKLYKTGLDPHHPDGKLVLPTICCHFDEVNEIAGPEFVPMVNKLGGSGFRISAYTQALQDIEAKVQDKAKAEQIVANFNHVVMLRVRSLATAKFFTDQLREVDVATLTQVSGVTDNSAEGTGIDFISRNEDEISTGKRQLVLASDMMQLPKGQAFALLEGNRLFKIRMPLADSSNDAFVPESLRAVSSDMRRRYRTSEAWWTETDWLASHPLGISAVGIIADDLADDRVANPAPVASDGEKAA